MKKTKTLLNKIGFFIDNEPAWKTILIACLAGLIIGVVAGFLDMFARDIAEQYNFIVTAEKYLR